MPTDFKPLILLHQRVLGLGQNDPNSGLPHIIVQPRESVQDHLTACLRRWRQSRWVNARGQGFCRALLFGAAK